MWLLIANPKAGLIRRKGKKVFAPLIEEMQRRGRDCEVVWTDSPEDGERQARAAAASGVEGVIAAGGDGTINQVARGLIGSGTALGLVPGGTVNVLARALGSGTRTQTAFATLLAGKARDYWPGTINGIPFLTMAGLGLDAAVVAATHDGLKKRIGRIAYPVTGLMRFGGLEKPPITGDLLPRPASLVVVGRTPLYGGTFPLMPDADTFGRRLGLFAFHSSRRLSTLKAMLQIIARGGRLPRTNDALISRGAGERFNFRTETLCHFQVDGEYAGSAREFAIGVSDQPLKLWL